MIAINSDHQVAAITWITNMSEGDKWNLSLVETASLLGLSLKTYQEIQQKVVQEIPLGLSDNTLERLSHLLGIWKSLQLIVPADRSNLAYSWFNQPINNEIFAGVSIKEFLLTKNESERFYIVRRYLEAAVS
jgi:hypothetical protein